MRKLFYFLVAAGIVKSTLQAQNWQWGKKLSPDSAGGYYFFKASNPAADNIYVYCSNNNSTPDEIRHFTGNGANDWSLTIPSNLRIYNMVADSIGNLIACGWFNGSLNFGGYSLNSAGFNDAVFFKTDPSGQFLFLHALGGAKDDYSFSVAVNNANEIYFAILLRDSLYSGPNKILADTSATETVISKYDPNGNLISAFKESNGQYHYGIDNIKMLIGGSGNIYFMSNIGYYSAYSYAKVLSPSGGVLGNMLINDGMFDIAIDSQENPYIIRNTAGHYYGSPLLLKCDQQFTIKWSRDLGGTYSPYEFSAITIDAKDRLFLPGCNGNSYFGYSGTNTFGSQSFNYNEPTTTLVAEMDTAGNYINVLEHPVKGSGGQAVFPDNQGNLYLLNDYRYCDTTFTVGADTITFSTAGFSNSSGTVLMKLGYEMPSLTVAKQGGGNDLIVSPNPTAGKVYVTYKGQGEKMTVVRMINSSGQIIFTDLITPEKLQETTLDLHGQPAGLYTLELISGTERITRKIVLE
ncbi:MAG: T9SS type A sorting domain-containing protein [Bacteroidia bacterium]